MSFSTNSISVASTEITAVLPVAPKKICVGGNYIIMDGKSMDSDEAHKYNPRGPSDLGSLGEENIASLIKDGNVREQKLRNALWTQVLRVEAK